MTSYDTLRCFSSIRNSYIQVSNWHPMTPYDTFRCSPQNENLNIQDGIDTLWHSLAQEFDTVWHSLTRKQLCWIILNVFLKNVSPCHTVSYRVNGHIAPTKTVSYRVIWFSDILAILAKWWACRSYWFRPKTLTRTKVTLPFLPHICFQLDIYSLRK